MLTSTACSAIESASGTTLATTHSFCATDNQAACCTCTSFFITVGSPGDSQFPVECTAWTGQAIDQMVGIFRA
jgi:hypothetical protein